MEPSSSKVKVSFLNLFFVFDSSSIYSSLIIRGHVGRKSKNFKTKKENVRKKKRNAYPLSTLIAN